MCSRNDFENLFIQHGYRRDEICSMPEKVFQRTLDSFLNEDQSPEVNPYYPETQYRYVSQRQAQENQKRYAAYLAELQKQQQQQNQNRQANSAYQDCDEEEALRIAMMRSLEENYAKPKEECPQPSNPNNDQTNSYRNIQNSRNIINEQNNEYRDACEQAFQTEMEQNHNKHFEENEAIIREEEQNQREAEVIGRYYGLKPEPQTGIAIAVNIFGQRYIRKFNSCDLAKDIYSWVAGQTINEDQKLYFDMFNLRKPNGQVLDPEMTLEEQGIKRSTMLQIELLTDED
ncbi:hypothetical protein GPJ56_003788 [Histomonas meleagridis]|uniref:uncharacterized protein n=1 Tax=Histomonas meleagridis TaxID=135588 RepID=UPI003559F6D0|nr:hypothetical protein GPJ56_003788 [Histomonas meleagridis]KAH0805246.1 hypothetical protein GO595_002191 [Histomonas meleagridis]